MIEASRAQVAGLLASASPSDTAKAADWLGKDACTGVPESVTDPLPSWPDVLSPQAYTWWSEPRARLVDPPITSLKEM